MRTLTQRELTKKIRFYELYSDYDSIYTDNSCLKEWCSPKSRLLRVINYVPQGFFPQEYFDTAVRMNAEAALLYAAKHLSDDTLKNCIGSLAPVTSSARYTIAEGQNELERRRVERQENFTETLIDSL